jgi:predicted HAD superfamily Cof-like phosphohydrolase
MRDNMGFGETTVDDSARGGGHTARDPELAAVAAMHAHHGLGPRPAVPEIPPHQLAFERYDFLKEELEEFIASFCQDDGPDLSGMLDALVDLVYVAKGTAAMLGVSPETWAQAFDEVDRSQRSKVRGVGKRGTANDLVKPEGWVAPDHGPRLRAAGWRP